MSQAIRFLPISQRVVLFLLIALPLSSGFIAISELFREQKNTFAFVSNKDLSNKQLQEKEKQIGHLHGLISQSNPKVSKARELAENIFSISAQYKMDPFFIAAVINYESRFNESAVSKAHAYGLMQILMPTARGVAQQDLEPKHVMERQINLNLGIKYLQQLLTRYNGNKKLALFAYNWGSAKVDRAQKNHTPIPSEVLKYASVIVKRHEIYARSM